MSARSVAAGDFSQDTRDGSGWGIEGVLAGGRARFRGHFERIAQEILRRTGNGKFQPTYIGPIAVRFSEHRANPLKKLE